MHQFHPEHLGWILDWLAEDKDLFVVRNSSIAAKIVRLPITCKGVSIKDMVNRRAGPLYKV